MSDNDLIVWEGYTVNEMIARITELEAALRAARRELVSCRDHFQIVDNIGGVYDVEPVLNTIDAALSARAATSSADTSSKPVGVISYVRNECAACGSGDVLRYDDYDKCLKCGSKQGDGTCEHCGSKEWQHTCAK